MRSTRMSTHFRTVKSWLKFTIAGRGCRAHPCRYRHRRTRKKRSDPFFTGPPAPVAASTHATNTTPPRPVPFSRPASSSREKKSTLRLKRQHACLHALCHRLAPHVRTRRREEGK
eukprot:1181356-Prorocentrum_minimum.AAC.1